MKSIFVSITSLEDKEALPTVLDAFDKAEMPERVFIGIAIASAKKDTLKQILAAKKKYKDNIRVSYDKVALKNHLNLFGVGRGRLRARKLYNSEDYFLQIDSHTMFEAGWDSKLIALHSEAKQELGLDKVIITAYAGKYYIDDNRNRHLSDLDNIPGTSKRYGFLYNTFYDGHSRYDIVPSWVVNDSEKIRSLQDKFVPSLKFNANFAFGDKEFAENLGITENEIFFEEELIQTIRLMSYGFALVHPNIESATIRHLYADYGTNEEIISSYKRTNLATEFYSVGLDYQKSLAMKNYLGYISDIDNRHAIESYQRYAGINLFSSRVNRNTILPSTWKLDILGSYPYNGSEV